MPNLLLKKKQKMNKTMNEILLQKNKKEEIDNTKSFIIKQINKHLN